MLDLTRGAYVYVRQSTGDQLLNNPESRRRQYALETRARSLGWENVIVIDDDSGPVRQWSIPAGVRASAGGNLVPALGAVLAIEASRLASQRPRLAHAAGILRLVNTLIIDEDGIHDPRLVNDRLLLGLKGTFSELEPLDVPATLARGVVRLKAARGELHTTRGDWLPAQHE